MVRLCAAHLTALYALLIIYPEGEALYCPPRVVKCDIVSNAHYPPVHRSRCPPAPQPEPDAADHHSRRNHSQGFTKLEGPRHGPRTRRKITMQCKLQRGPPRKHTRRGSQNASPCRNETRNRRARWRQPTEPLPRPPSQ
eukprot:5122675-Prymnesium_polylepis.1